LVDSGADLAYLLGVTQADECRLLIVEVCHLHCAPSRQLSSSGSAPFLDPTNTAQPAGTADGRSSEDYPLP
jgi:hypothetical protein